MKSLPCWLMRGGTSKGPFFLAKDLPQDINERDRIILAAMGSPDSRQIDGLGGADSLTSKVGILSLPEKGDNAADLNFLFAQVSIDEARVDTTPNCGNMLAAAGPAAIEAGLIKAQGELTTIRIRTLNTNMIAEVIMQTPNGRPKYEGSTQISGVPGSAAPVLLNFLETAGSVCGSLLPTGRICDQINGIPVTCIDNGMPVIIIKAASLGISGYESKDTLNQNQALKNQINTIRLAAGKLMGIDDLENKSIPKISLVSPPQSGGTICTRTFIPHNCHAAIGVLGAVTVATAAALSGSVAYDVAQRPAENSDNKLISIEHPTGEFSVELKLGLSGEIEQAALVRTARLIMSGTTFITS